MGSPVKDAKLKAQQIWPGAIVAERGKGYIKHQHPTDPTKFMLDTSVGGIGWHFGNGPYSETEEVDTAWHPTGGGAWQFEMLLADYHAYARDILNVGDIINYADPASGESVTFQPLSLNWVDNITNSRQELALPQAVVAQVLTDKLYWQNGYGAGKHFSWQTNPSQLVKVFTIDSNNLPVPTVSNPFIEIEFIVKYSSGLTILIDGVEWNKRDRITTATDIEFRRTSTGATLWSFRKPQAWDNNSNQISGLMQVERRGSTQYITVRWPKAWVDVAQFPINLDVTIEPVPGTSTDDAVEDTSPYVTTGQTQPYVLQNNWLGVRFQNVTVPVGATIDVAYVKLYLTGATNTIGETYYFEAADSGATFTEGEGTGISGRSKTSSINDAYGSVAQFTWYNTASLVTPFQAVINRPGWASGNAAVFLDDHTNASSYRLRLYDNGSDYPVFHIEYTAGGGVSGSASLSPSASASPSVSPSISPSYSLSPSASASPSKSPSASLSPSASVSPSISPSASASPSLSPSASVSPSLSPSASVSPSLSLSASVSPSVSRSISPSVSPSISPSISPSASAAPPIEGSTCWGHITGVIETNIRTFTGNWTGTGIIENAGDAERLALETTEYMISEVVYTTARMVELDQNHYDPSGDNVNLDYRHGATQAECEAAAWNDYTVPFNSLGYVQVRVTSTL